MLTLTIIQTLTLTLILTLTLLLTLITLTLNLTLHCSQQRVRVKSGTERNAGMEQTCCVPGFIWNGWNPEWNVLFRISALFDETRNGTMYQMQQISDFLQLHSRTFMHIKNFLQFILDLFLSSFKLCPRRPASDFANLKIIVPVNSFFSGQKCERFNHITSDSSCLKCC